MAVMDVTFAKYLSPLSESTPNYANCESKLMRLDGGVAMDMANVCCRAADSFSCRMVDNFDSFSLLCSFTVSDSRLKLGATCYCKIVPQLSQP